MAYKFKSECLKLQAESVIMAAFEGDNEHAIIDTGSNGSPSYHVVTFNHGREGMCLNAEEHSNMPDAIKALSGFMVTEYAGV